MLARFGQIASLYDAIHHQHKVELFKGPNVAQLQKVQDKRLGQTEKVISELSENQVLQAISINFL